MKYRKPGMKFSLTLLAITLFATFSHHLHRVAHRSSASAHLSLLPSSSSSSSLSAISTDDVVDDSSLPSSSSFSGVKLSSSSSSPSSSSSSLSSSSALLSSSSLPAISTNDVVDDSSSSSSSLPSSSSFSGVQLPSSSSSSPTDSSLSLSKDSSSSSLSSSSSSSSSSLPAIQASSLTSPSSAINDASSSSLPSIKASSSSSSSPSSSIKTDSPSSSSSSSPSLSSSTTTTSSSTAPLSTVSILIPDWEVLVLVSPQTPPQPTLNYTCIFPNHLTSPARHSGTLPFRRGTAFKCLLPPPNRRRLPFLQPRLVPTTSQPDPPFIIPHSYNDFSNIYHKEELLRWNGIAYESFTTENDVVLLVKGVNNRQGVNRHPSTLRCVFLIHDDDPLTAVRTSVLTSAQEVFRCALPHLIKDKHKTNRMKVTLEILAENEAKSGFVVPSVAYYHAPGWRMRRGKVVTTCACTMVYNVAKFLEEWVTYHGSIGVERFVLYDNDSDDGLGLKVEEMRRKGFDVRTVYWPWPKTQEAGFSHCALVSQGMCEWVAFVDVDEFVVSPSWLDVARPDGKLLESTILPKKDEMNRVGQVSIGCNEFGPSNQTAHPPDGVTQGYTCRRRLEQRHKSMVFLEAMHPSLLNVVHHFDLKEGYRTNQVLPNQAVVNHYKYQAWPEFRAKFRRRVSAYVVDWRQSLNPMSNDRAPGLGFEPVEPPGWAQRFCEVEDDRLKVLTRRWFGVNSTTMAWQSA